MTVDKTVNDYLLSVPVAFGVESLAAREIRLLGYRTEKVEDGRISFLGGDRAICRSNIWLRFAERVQIKLGDFTALNFNDLFEQTKELRWRDLLPPDASFPVTGHCLSSTLGSVPACQSIIKKAIVEAIKVAAPGNWLSESGAPYRVNFNIIRDRVTIYVDTSGDGLHKRGYRANAALAPIRETLAAALVGLSGWRPGMALWDPFCGSGTIAIEAAMMALNRAPGLERGFAAEAWDNGTPLKRLFDEERAQARAAYEEARGGLSAANSPVEIAGSDLSRQYVHTARQNAVNAGTSRLIRFFQMDAKHMSLQNNELSQSGVRFPDRGCVVSNPPYGERDDDLPAARETCREWAPTLAGFPAWNKCIISAFDDFERLIGATAGKRRKLRNGKIKCQAYMYYSADRAP